MYLKQSSKRKYYSLCVPELVPHITGGDKPSPLLTLKVSVRHLVDSATSTVPVGARAGELAKRLDTEADAVLGPVMTKESKSSRS